MGSARSFNCSRRWIPNAEQISLSVPANSPAFGRPSVRLVYMRHGHHVIHLTPRPNGLPELGGMSDSRNILYFRR